MSAPAESAPKVRIAHVLSTDVVGYSLLLITEQTRIMNELTSIVKNTAQFREADARGNLMRIPTGDGMSLVFFDDPQAPIECAAEIASALEQHPDIQLRMGIHSGPINEVIDVSDRSNVAGAGIDMAQRVMNCGDAGHILLSKRVAEDLAPYPRWHSHLHDLGECEVKHGRKIGLVNFYTGEIGNPAAPKLCAARDNSAIARSTSSLPGSSGRKRMLIAAAAFCIIAVALGVFVFSRPNVAPLWKNSGAGHSIAVLPFQNASNDPNTEYLAEGIAEALINSLAELQQLKVIARSTAFHYKGNDVDPRRVGRELQVTAVLTGKIRQVQDTLTVQVDLIDATTGGQLWGKAYEQTISNVVSVKQAIAREVSEKLKLKLSGEDERRLVKRDSSNSDAYQSYLRGRYFWNKRTPNSIKQALEEFQKAIDQDPNFALAYSGLADSYLLLQQYVGTPSKEAIPKARAAADRAIQIDDSLAEAHTSSAGIYQFMWEWAKAEEEHRRAIALNENYATAHHWYSLVLQINKRWDEALREIKLAQELDPLSPIIGANLVIIYLNTNQLGAALTQCHKILELDPNHIAGHDWLGWIYSKQGRFADAIKEREKVVEMSQRAAPQLSGLGYVYARAGRKSEARAIVKDLEERYARGEAAAQIVAVVYIGLEEFDQAFAWLEKDIEQRNAELQFITIRVQFEPIRSDPRYANLVRRMGLNP